MTNSHRFFSNVSCRYFPCHSAPEKELFNCLFCYCPLYALGEKCGGSFKRSGPKRKKDCTGCELPHRPEYYDVIVTKLKE